MIVADFPAGDDRELYESFRRSMFCDDAGRIYNLIRSNKLVTVLGGMTVGQVVRVHRVKETESHEVAVIEIGGFRNVALLESKCDLYWIAPAVQIPYLGEPFSIAYLEPGEEEPKFEPGVVTSVRVEDHQFRGSVKSKNRILPGGPLFDADAYEIIGMCVRCVKDEEVGEGGVESWTVYFSPSGDFF